MSTQNGCGFFSYYLAWESQDCQSKKMLTTDTQHCPLWDGSVLVERLPNSCYCTKKKGSSILTLQTEAFIVYAHSHIITTATVLYRGLDYHGLLLLTYLTKLVAAAVGKVNCAH